MNIFLYIIWLFLIQRKTEYEKKNEIQKLIQKIFKILKFNVVYKKIKENNNINKNI
jgi:hypothetical protein